MINQNTYSADAMMMIFEPVRKMMERLPVVILGVSDIWPALLIGDCPVLSLAGPKLANELFGPSVGAYFLPLGRHHAAFTVQRPDTRLSEDDVAYLNRLQIESALKTIVWCPDDDYKSFVNSTLDAY